MDEDLVYPRSRASNTSEVLRSPMWDDDITRNWNLPVAGLESVEERVTRYKLYFTLTASQLTLLLRHFQEEMRRGLEVHQKASPWDHPKCSMKMLDTWVTYEMIPRGNEKGTAFALDFGGSGVDRVNAVKLTMEGNGVLKTARVGLGLREIGTEYPKGLLDRRASASELFDALGGIVKKLEDEHLQKGGGDKKTDCAETPLGFSVCFPLEQRGLNCATLLHWTKGYETGRDTNDPIEGVDLSSLLECALRRQKVASQVRCVSNDSTGALLACAYEKPAKLPPCRAAIVIGEGFNGCYVMSERRKAPGYKGCVVNTELCSFERSLPLNDVDLEVDFADATTKGVQLFEKMVSATYLGELCRRLVLKVWQNEAPPLAWVRYTTPWLACHRVIADTSDDLKVTGEVLEGLWEWTTTAPQRKVVQQLFHAVFDRSAALAAVAVAALALQTDRLQSAMGGLTIALVGSLCAKTTTYLPSMNRYLEMMLGDQLARLIHFYPVENAAEKGSAILAWKVTEMNFY